MAFLLNGTPVHTGAPFWRQKPFQRTTFAYPAMAEKLNRDKKLPPLLGGWPGLAGAGGGSSKTEGPSSSWHADYF